MSWSAFLTKTANNRFVIITLVNNTEVHLDLNKIFLLQKDVETQISGPASISGGPQQKLFLGNFMKPYFKDKLSGLVGCLFIFFNLTYDLKKMLYVYVHPLTMFCSFQGPPANEETKEKMINGTRLCDDLKTKRCIVHLFTSLKKVLLCIMIL